MQIKHVIAGILMSAACCSAVAQSDTTRVWGLQECIDYAKAHNIDLQRSRINLEEYRIDTKRAKAQLFPSLAFSTSHSYGNTPFADSSQGIAKNVYDGSYNLNAAWTIFQGGKLLTSVKQQKLQEESQQYLIEEATDNIELSILRQFLQILYAEESIEICRQTLLVSERQLDRAQKLLDAGSLSKSDFAQINAQYSENKYQLVVAEANRDQQLLELKQMLELGISEELALKIPEIGDIDILSPLPAKQDIYNTALSFIPSIQSSRVNEKIATLQKKIASGGYAPTLTLNAGVGTGSTSNDIYSFGTQMKQRLNENIGLTLSIPIYSKRENRSAVQKAKLQIRNSRLETQNAEKELRNQVETAWLDANSSQIRYTAARDQVESAEQTYMLVEEQFNLGIANTLELLTAKNDLLNARMEELQAKYMALLNLKLLDFYSHKEITLN